MIVIRDLTSGDYNWLERTLGAFFVELTEALLDQTFSPAVRYKMKTDGVFAADAPRVFAGLYLRARVGTPMLAVAAVERSEQGEEEFVAFILARLQERPARLPGKILLLDAAYTLPEYRSRGYMGTLLERAMAFAQENRIERLELGTPAGGPARDYWSRRGFVEDFVQMGRGIDD